MNTILKVGLWAGAAGLVWWGYKTAKKTFAAFQLDVVGYGRPSLAGAMLTVPLQIRFDNPTPLPIVVDRLTADVFILKAGQYVPAARMNEPVTIPPGKSTQWIAPVANLQSIFGGDLLQTALFIQQIVATKKIQIRSDVVATYKGLELPMQSFTNTLDV